MFLKLLSEYRWGCIKMTSEYAFDMVFLLEFNMFLLDLWIHLIGLSRMWRWVFLIEVTDN